MLPSNTPGDKPQISTDNMFDIMFDNMFDNMFIQYVNEKSCCNLY